MQNDTQQSASAGPLFLAIDQGGHASRAVVFDQFGKRIVEALQVVDVSHPQPDWVEQNADALVQSVQSVLGEVIEKLGERRHDIVAAGLVTQRSNIVCWERTTGRALSPAISWQDRRAYRWMQTFDEHTSAIRRITGLVPSAHYGASKIHWCLENLPEVIAAHAKGNLACGPLASFLLCRLLKEQPFVVDAVNASRTLLWDRASHNWSATLLKLFSLDADYLPHCVPNRYAFGNLDVAGQAIPLTVCSGDQSAALFSLGMPSLGSAYLNMGTGAFMQCLLEPSRQNKKLPARLLQSVVWNEAADSMQVVEATVNGAGSALAVVEKELGISSEQSQSNYAQWLAGAKNIPLYLNGVSGIGSPFWVPEFDSRFVERTAEKSTPGEKIVAVMESILFLLQINLEELRLENVMVKKIVISGGLSVLRDLCQRLADLSGLPVIRPHQTEATAKGLAFLLASPYRKSLIEKKPLFKRDEMWTEKNAADHFTPATNLALCERYRQWRIVFDDALNEKVKS